MRLSKVCTTAVLATAVMASSSVIAAEFTGAGASFPYPIYAKWAEAYKNETGNSMNYQAIGSGGGIKQIKAKTVDFGASDKPLKAKELDKHGLIQFPMVMGGVVPVVNLDGIKPGQLKLSGDVLADIYLGKIKKWNSPKIAEMNPGLNLPSKNIIVVRRADGSGTTFLFTSYLAKVSQSFKDKVGVGKAVKWPTGLGGKGNDGVAATVKRIRGTIGYVEYAYAKRNKIPHAQLKNKAGNFVQPNEKSFKAAAAGADWKNTPGFRVILTDQAGKGSWPISGASFILMYKKQDNAATAKEVLKFLDWSYKNGGAMASQLDYVAMPKSVIKLVQKVWEKEIKDSSGKAVW